MTQIQALNLIIQVRADYVATLRDNHRLAKCKTQFDPAKMPLVVAMDEAIRELSVAASDIREGGSIPARYNG